MEEIFTLYIEDVNNLKDEDGRFKTYQQVKRDLKGLVSPYLIKKMLWKMNAKIAYAMTTRRKKHSSKGVNS